MLKLKEQIALSGLAVDPKILIEAEDIEAEIENLQAELEALDEDEIEALDKESVSPSIDQPAAPPISLSGHF